MVRPLKDNTYLIKANLYGYAWEVLDKLNLSYKWYYNSLNNETKVKLTDKGEITFKENLNSNDKIVNAILARIEKNNGECPCSHPENDGDLHCPCDSYKLRDKCCCNLYIKNESTNSK